MNQIVSKLKIVLTEVVDSTGKKHDHPGGGGGGFEEIYLNRKISNIKYKTFPTLNIKTIGWDFF